MSYAATGHGRIVLLHLNQNQQQDLYADLVKHYDKRAELAIQASNSTYHHEMVRRNCVERQKQLLYGAPMLWMNQVFREVGFSDLDATDATTLEMSFSANYYESDIYALLRVLTPYLTAGSFDFLGEDGERWKIELESGDWREQSGEIVYTDLHKGGSAQGPGTAIPEESPSVQFSYNGTAYTMTADAIEAAYRYQKHQYMLLDAMRQLDWFVFGADPDALDETECSNAIYAFEQAKGIRYEDAKGLAEQFLQRFEKNSDCNQAENDVWRQAITEVLSETDQRKPKAEDGHADH